MADRFSVPRNGTHGQVRDIEHEFERATCTTADPVPAAFNNRGAVLAVSGDLAGALADFDRAIALDSTNEKALVNRGTTLRVLGRPMDALADYTQALRLRPGLPHALEGRALAGLAAGDAAGALVDFDAWVAAAPTADAYHGRGGCRHALQDFAGAVADYDRALAIDPMFCIAYVSRGNARHHLLDPDAVGDFRAAYHLDPAKAVAETVRGVASGLVRDGLDALKASRKHVRIAPKDVAARVRLAMTLVLLGRGSEADEETRWAIAIRPDFYDHIRDLLAEAARVRAAVPPIG
ncbi:tetratricopeptide repeat protein [Tundrisphaera sp. TA3]|uniref:tetratricopeptide repeat protein n=1 Tax=Tundrisphaera sp. TA3 TaxID=3435775 RepID=UPI003EB8E218